MTDKQAPAYTFIKCVCGNNIFVPGKMLGPGTKKPVVLKSVWVCAGCGMQYLPDDFPKKGENDRRESKLLLPDSNKKLTLIQ